MNINIKQRAKDIMKADMVTMLMGAGIFAIVNMLVTFLNTNQVGSIFAGFISAISSACAACFFFRAFNRGRGDVYDTYALLTDSVNLAKASTIMVAVWIVETLTGLLTNVLVMIPLLGTIAAMVIIIMVPYLLMIVWYLFVANPQYPVDYYLKASVKYMSGKFLMYIGFAIALGFVPWLIELALATFLGSAIASVLCLPLEAYISLAMAGYFTQLIPSSWYAGTERF